MNNNRSQNSFYDSAFFEDKSNDKNKNSNIGDLNHTTFS